MSEELNENPQEGASIDEAAEEQTAPAAPKNDNPNLKWYVVHTYSGYENKARQSLQERVRSLGAQRFFGEVLVPQESVVEMVRGQKRTTKRKFFPGYILVQMELTNETWHIVKGTPKVTGFVGGAVNPPSLPEDQVRGITQQVSEGVLRPKPKVKFERGETVRIVDGPFTSFSGVVEEVYPE
ncbi:MAG: transcription termination/antitermination protein NusG, partial [Candidatus Methylomirabilis sp.]|nr:transcription termination/antitermination protein NusG [Deltaproteobacteria bacterium]